MKKIIVIFLVLLFSCEEKQNIYIVDSDLSIYVDAFFQQASIHGIEISKENLVVRKSVSISPKLGLFSISDGQRVVEINAYSVNDLNNDYVEAIVFHELGHALLNKPHQDDVKSLMNTNPCLKCYADEKKLYIDQLFSR